MPVFFVTADQIQNGTVTITGPLCAHLRASLRLRVGETIWLGDERRQRYLINTTHLDRRSVTGQVLERIAGPAQVHPSVILGQTLLKGDRMDWVIQKATELGMASLIPIVTSHTVVRPRTDRHSSQQDRWQKIAIEASQQSERWEVPTIAGPCDTATFFETQQQASCRLILSERSDGQSLATVALPSKPDESLLIAVGPEGGWTKEELGQAQACGFLPVTLGKRILRAETAALASLSVIQSRLGELG